MEESIEKQLLLFRKGSFDSPKIPKSASMIQLSRSSNSYFTQTTGLISSFKVVVESFTLVEETSLQKTYSGTWCWNLIAWRRLQNVPIILRLLDIQTFFLGIHGMDQFRQGFNRKLKSCRDISPRETLHVVLCVGILVPPPPPPEAFDFVLSWYSNS